MIDYIVVYTVDFLLLTSLTNYTKDFKTLNPQKSSLLPWRYIKQITGVARNFDWKGASNWKKLWRYFGVVFRWRYSDGVTELTS